MHPNPYRRSRRQRTRLAPSSSELREALREVCLQPYTDRHPEKCDMLARALIDRALEGDYRALLMIVDAVDGPIEKRRS